MLDHPLHWKTVNFLEHFSNLKYETFLQERERIDNILSMLDKAPQYADNDGAKGLASKKHAMWIAELLDNSWSDSVIAEMNAFEEDTKGDGIPQFYVCLRKNIGHTKEAIIAAEQQLSKDKLALENFNHDINKFTTHVRTYIRQIMSTGLQPTNQHFILIFSSLKEVEQDEFKLTIMKLYEGWRTGSGEGSNITILQLLARANSEYKRLQNGSLKIKGLLGLQAKFNLLQVQFQALVSEQAKLKAKHHNTSTRPEGVPNPEENETCSVNGQTWYYCKKCFAGWCWNKPHKSDNHRGGAGKPKDDEAEATNKDKATIASYDTGFGSDADFQSGWDRLL